MSTTIDLPRFRTRQHRAVKAPARREPMSNRQLLLLVLFLQGATLGVVIGGGIFFAVMLSGITSQPALTTPATPHRHQVAER